MFRPTLITIILGLWLPGSFTSADQPARTEGEGIAAKYPGDVGIDKDQAVILAEDFETGRLDQIAKRWGYASNKNGKVHAFSDDVPPESAGRGEQTGLALPPVRNEKERRDVCPAGWATTVRSRAPRRPRRSWRGCFPGARRPGW